MTQPHAGDDQDPTEDRAPEPDAAEEDTPEQDAPEQATTTEDTATADTTDEDAVNEGAVEERAPEGRPRGRAALTAVWRERRGLVLATAAAAVVAVVAATLGVTQSVEDDRPVPSGSIPTLGSQFATPPSGPPSSSPAKPAALPAYTGSPLWTVPLPAGTEEYDLPGFAVTAAGYLLENREEVIGLDKAGKQIWRFTPPEVDYFTVRVTGPQVIIGYNNPGDDRWPQPQVIIALDPATGAELWRETEASLWSVSTDTIYMSVCYGGQNNRIGDCTLSARDPADNTTRWQVPTYASSRVEYLIDRLQAIPTPPYLLVGAYATGADTYVLSANDPASGTTLGRGYDGGDGRIGSIAATTERTIVTDNGSDDNPADGCTALLTGFSVSGAGQKWQYTARTAKRYDGKYCGSLPESTNDGRLGVTAENGAPGVLNLETGVVEWSAPVGGEAVAASDTTLLVVESTGAENAELVAYRVGDAEPAWRAPFLGSVDGAQVTITDTHVVVTESGRDAVGYDLKTGKAWSYGAFARLGDTWFAVCSETECKGYAIA
jgi:hypothetical protein